MGYNVLLSSCESYLNAFTVCPYVPMSEHRSDIGTSRDIGTPRDIALETAGNCIKIIFKFNLFYWNGGRGGGISADSPPL